jgi:hypothetical protein
MLSLLIHNSSSPSIYPRKVFSTENTSLTSLSKILEIAHKALKNTQETSFYLFDKVQHILRTTPLSPIFENIHKACMDLEKIFNIGGCVPCLGLLSGTFRILFGQAQVVCGVVISVFCEMNLVIINFSKKTDFTILSKWQILSKLGTEITIHGCLNILRGMGETLIGSYSLGIGNICLIAPNLLCERNFNPYFPYGSMTHHIQALKSEYDLNSRID